MTDPRVPVTVLTGFLGAGKTTVLNAILSDSTAGRVAVIVNEYGDVGIDHDLIVDSTDEVLLLQSGCLCCSMRGDLSETMRGLLAQREAGELAFDRVLIETTGLAAPGPVLQTLLVDSQLAKSSRMDGVVTVVDAINGPATFDAHVEAAAQIAMADLIVLSKTDRATRDQLSLCEDQIRALNPNARLVHAVRGQGIADTLWNLSALYDAVTATKARQWVQGQENSSVEPHDARIATASITLDQPLSDQVFDTWLDTLIGLRGADILRIKGIVFLQDIETPFVFHGVQHIFDPPVPIRNWHGQDRHSRIVVIARDLTRQELERSLDMLRAKPKPKSTATLIHEVAQ